uniref:Uncharacterized protein n=2 Tax=Clastoptera arizonana TaxID=38151 RepID=A0A1B6CFI3_9HEMI
MVSVRGKREADDNQGKVNPLLFGNQNLFSANQKLGNHIKSKAYDSKFWGNQNLFSANFQSSNNSKSKKKDEGLNPLLYGNQNLFSANHHDYLRLSDIFSPFAKPPYGIPIDSDIKKYNNVPVRQASNPFFNTKHKQIKTKEEIIQEKTSLLRMLQMKRQSLQADSRVNFQNNLQDDHVINKRNVWQDEKYHPMIYGQKRLPNNGKLKNIPIDETMNWLPYVDMEKTLLIKSNPKEARIRLKEYYKLSRGRDENKMRDAMRLREEKRRLQDNPKYILNQNKEYRKALIRNGIIPGKEINIKPQEKQVPPLKIRRKDEIDERSWMPYVDMNAVIAKAAKKTPGNHKIRKRDISPVNDYIDAQQGKRNRRDIKNKTSVEDMFASYFDHSATIPLTENPVFTTQKPTTIKSPDDSSFEEYKDEIEDVTAYHGFMYWTRPPTKPPRTHRRYTKPTEKDLRKKFIWPEGHVEENHPVYISRTKPPPRELDEIQKRFLTRATPKYVPYTWPRFRLTVATPSTVTPWSITDGFHQCYQYSREVEVFRVKREDITQPSDTNKKKKSSQKFEEVDFTIEYVTTKKTRRLLPLFSELQVVKDIKKTLISQKEGIENVLLHILSYVATVYHFFRKCFTRKSS